jgi:hypothetical protein
MTVDASTPSIRPHDVAARWNPDPITLPGSIFGDAR